MSLHGSMVEKPYISRVPFIIQGPLTTHFTVVSMTDFPYFTDEAENTELARATLDFEPRSPVFFSLIRCCSTGVRLPCGEGAAVPFSLEKRRRGRALFPV